jgi:hypothetical protein
MQYAPHGVELQWQARERVAGDGAATGLLLEQNHDLFHVGSVQKASLQVPLLTTLQRRPDVTTDVVIIFAEFGGSHLPQLVLPVFPGWVELASRNLLRKDSAKTQQCEFHTKTINTAKALPVVYRYTSRRAALTSSGSVACRAACCPTNSWHTWT